MYSSSQRPMKLSRIHISRYSQCYPSCAAIYSSDWPTCIAADCRDPGIFTSPFVRSKTGSVPTGQLLARPFGRLQQAEAMGKNVELMMRGSTSMVALGSRYNNIQPHSSHLRRLPLLVNNTLLQSSITASTAPGLRHPTPYTQSASPAYNNDLTALSHNHGTSRRERHGSCF